MFNIRYKGLKLIPSRSAMREMSRHGMMIADCKAVLEQGYEPRKRGKGTVEKWLDSGSKTCNVVVTRSYSYAGKEEVYLIMHVGKFSKKKNRVGG